MDTLYTFWDNITHYKTESVNVLGLMNSATQFQNPLTKAYASNFNRIPRRSHYPRLPERRAAKLRGLNFGVFHGLYGSFRKLGVPYFRVLKDPTIYSRRQKVGTWL